MSRRAPSGRQKEKRRATVARRSMVARGLSVASEGGRRPELHLPGVQPVYEAIIAEAGDLVTCTNAWDAEQKITAIWAGLKSGAPATAALDLVLKDLITEAARVGNLGSYLLLRGLAVVGPYGIIEQARSAAATLAVRKPSFLADAPRWVELLGSVKVGDCHRYTDVFGEKDYLICEFRHDDGDRRHALVVTIERACHGLPSRIVLIPSSSPLDALLKEMTRDVDRNDGKLEVIPASEAARSLRMALLISNSRTDLPDTFPAIDVISEGVLPLLVQRIGVMADVDDLRRSIPQVAQEWPAQRRATFVQEFLGARQRELSGVERADQLAARIVDLSVDYLGCSPDRTGPVTVERLILDILPGYLTMPDSMIDEVVLVVKEWLAWRLNLLDAPTRARVELLAVNDRVVKVLPTLLRDHLVHREYPYVADLPRDCASGEIQVVLERRSFAVPRPGRRGDGEIQLDSPSNGLPAGVTDVDDLNAAVPEHRGLITLVWLEANNAASPDLFASRAKIIEQIWDDEPQQVWITAQQLSASGLSRLKVIDRLAAVWRRRLSSDGESPSAAADLDRGAYVRDLASLTAPHRRTSSHVEG
jgi:hypothetical protein